MSEAKKLGSAPRSQAKRSFILTSCLDRFSAFNDACRDPPSWHQMWGTQPFEKPGKEIYPRDENGRIIYDKTNLCATWEALEACKDAGLVKSLGVSNFNRRQLELILNKPGLKYKPVTNQVECHPYFTQTKLLKFCQQHDIVIVAHSPLGTCRNPSWVNVSSPPLLNDELLTSLGKKYNKTQAQIVLRFNIQRGIVVIPKSFTPERIKENFQIFDFSLTEEEMKDIDALNKNVRYVELLMWSDHPEYPFHDEY